MPSNASTDVASDSATIVALDSVVEVATNSAGKVTTTTTATTTAATTTTTNVVTNVATIVPISTVTTNVEPSSTTNRYLIVDISDVLSERDRVKFTVHTKTNEPEFSKQQSSVVRQHEEFVWLHDCLEDDERYAGYIIPPGPPRPDFDASREKLHRLGEGEGNMTKEEFDKMKAELEAEYLATFKKTVAMHEIFLQRLASHPKFRYDSNLRIFLEYENELSVRNKSKKERLAGLINNISRSAHDLVITTSQAAASSAARQRQLTSSGDHNVSGSSSSSSGHTSVFGTTSQNTNNNNNVSDINDNESKIFDHNSSGGTGGSMNNGDFFERERLFLALYYNSIKETTLQADKMTRAHKNVAESFLHLSSQINKLATMEDHDPSLNQLLTKFADYLDRARKIENRIASDEDLKLSDTFRYYKRDTAAAQDLLSRRLRYHNEYEKANKALDAARSRNRQLQYADVIQKQACENFQSISKLARQELTDYKQRRVAAFKKNFSDLVDLELKHVRSHTQLIKGCLDSCKGITSSTFVQAI